MNPLKNLTLFNSQAGAKQGYLTGGKGKKCWEDNSKQLCEESVQLFNNTLMRLETLTLSRTQSTLACAGRFF